MLICPICKTKLNKEKKSYFCLNNHCFDISKKGYVNLLMSQSKKSKIHGDDKLMTLGRREFLNSGHYTPLLECIKLKTLSFSKIVDVGCGDGYYTCGIAKKDSTVVGIDISKDIISSAASRLNGENVIFAVGNCANLPIDDGVADCILSVFAPVHVKEFTRILSNEGIIVRVVPGLKHLFELKKAVYDNPRLNDELDLEIEGFEILSKNLLNYTFTAKNKEIKNLFSMTPYYYKTSDADKDKLNQIENLDITAEFIVVVYKKE